MQSSNRDVKLIAIVGMTASGKSALAINIAKKYEGEVICADSRTVYKGLDIGTAKPTKEDQKAIKHHIVDVVWPDQTFTVKDFKISADQAIEDIQNRNKLPILVGGSGLYVDSVLYDFSFTDSTERDSTNPRHAHNLSPKSRKPLKSGTYIIGINPGREIIKKNIEKRVEQMVDDGLIAEIKRLFARYKNEKAMQSTGYKAFANYIEGLITLDEAKKLFIANDTNLAKRQLTWFKRNKDIVWFEKASLAEKYIDELLAS